MSLRLLLLAEQIAKMNQLLVMESDKSAGSCLITSESQEIDVTTNDAEVSSRSPSPAVQDESIGNNVSRNVDDIQKPTETVSSRSPSPAVQDESIGNNVSRSVDDIQKPTETITGDKTIVRNGHSRRSKNNFRKKVLEAYTEANDAANDDEEEDFHVYYRGVTAHLPAMCSLTYCLDINQIMNVRVGKTRGIHKKSSSRDLGLPENLVYFLIL